LQQAQIVGAALMSSSNAFLQQHSCYDVSADVMRFCNGIHAMMWQQM
jgi:hypothetical protein